MTTATLDPVTAYALDVVDGRVVAGRLVRLACQRHLRDLETGHERGMSFDAGEAGRVIRFFGTLVLPDIAQPFTLQPWQAFVIGSLYGWKRADGARRFQTLYLEVGRGNGKSPLLAGMALYAVIGDGEQSAQVFSAATTREQARIIFEDVRNIIMATPRMPARVRILKTNIVHPASSSFIRPLSSDASKMDGLRVHFAAIDEVHEHPDGDVIGKLRAAFKGRRQPMIAEATTAGFDRHTICWEHHEFSVRVLEGLTPNDSWFAYIATLDEGDDWRAPDVWEKANPNIDISVRRDFIAGQVQEAIDMPGKQNIVRRLHLNVWTEQANRFLDMGQWDAQEPATPREDLAGRECYGGLDLASTTDVAAFTLWFPGDGGGDLLAWFWIPEEAMRTRSRRDGVPYEMWTADGHMEATEGNVVDYDVIRERIVELSEVYDIRELAVDRWNSTQLQTQLLGAGLTVIQFGQGFASMNAPSKEIGRLVSAGKLRHGGNPVLRWMASNVAVEQDASGNMKLSKAKSTEKIDGIVAAGMAIGRAMSPEPSNKAKPPNLWIFDDD